MARRRILVLLPLLLLPAASPSSAYRILVDIDLDGDPATVNELTYQTSATVKLILAPTEENESITEIEFGLGGSCRECQGVHEYGVDHDLFPFQGSWVDHPDFDGEATGILLLGCPGEVGFHELYRAWPTAGDFVLEAPIFLAAFTASVADVEPGCPVPPANLGAFDPGNGLYNYVQIGGPALDVAERTWSAWKAGYR